MSTNTETTATNELKEHPTLRERVLAVAGWLVDGKLRPECVAAAMREWDVSRRTAQVYVARAAGRIVKATTFADPLFALKLSQVQRGKLFQELQELLRDGQFLPLPQWKMKLQTVQATIRLLDSRDRTAAKLAQMSPAAPVSDGGCRARERPAPAPEPAKEMLRPAPAPAKPIPPAPPIPPHQMERACASILGIPAQATERLSIVPQRPKAQAGKGMQPVGRAEQRPAPEPDSCALRTGAGANAALESPRRAERRQT